MQGNGTVILCMKKIFSSVLHEMGVDVVLKG